MELRETDKLLIDAVIHRAERLCPEALDLIAVYGSVLTGDTWEKSDLDLAIVINSPAGYELAQTFLLEDTGIGYDLYCTTWEQLEEMPRYPNPQLAKLMDSVVVWRRNEEAEARLTCLRAECAEKLAAPFSENDLAGVRDQLRAAEHSFALAMTADSFSEARLHAYGAVQSSMDAVMLVSKRYYRKGVRRVFDELREAGAPEGFEELSAAVIKARTADELRASLTALMRLMEAFAAETAKRFAAPKQAPTPGSLRGTYEEMCSNWAGKLLLAEQTGDRWLAFASESCLQDMLAEIGDAVELPAFDVLAGYDPDDLAATRARFRESLNRYRAFCEACGLHICTYPDVQAFREAYCQ